MPELQALQLNLTVSVPDGTEEELDSLTRQLLSELKNFDIESLNLAAGGKALSGTKGVDSIAAGTIAMAVLPNILPQVLAFLQAWSLQGRGRSIKFKGKIANQQIDFEGSFEEMEKLVALLEQEKKKRKK
jgi:hypothetical protein